MKLINAPQVKGENNMPVTNRYQHILKLYNKVLRTGTDVDAELVYYRIVELEPSDAVGYYEKALILRKICSNMEELIAYDEAIELNPKYVEAYYEKGNTLVYMARYEEAIKCFDKVIKLKPDYAEAYYKKGWTLYEFVKDEIIYYAYCKKGSELLKYEKAIKCLDEAIKLSPRNKRYRNMREQVLMAIQKELQLKKQISKSYQALKA